MELIRPLHAYALNMYAMSLVTSGTRLFHVMLDHINMPCHYHINNCQVRAHTLPFLYLGLYCGGALIFPQSVHPNFYLSKWSRSSKTASFYLSPSSYSLANCFKIGKEENKNYNPKFLWKSCCTLQTRSATKKSFHCCSKKKGSSDCCHF